MKNIFRIWEKLRGRGKWSFILIHGVLLWGVSTALLFSLIFSLVMVCDFMSIFVFSIILFPLGGVIWGYFMWIFRENLRKN